MTTSASPKARALRRQAGSQRRVPLCFQHEGSYDARSQGLNWTRSQQRLAICRRLRG